MTIKTHTTIQTQDHTTGEYSSEFLGAFTDGTRDLCAISIHDVLGITQRSKTLDNGTVVVTVQIETTGGTLDVSCFHTNDVQ